MKNLINNTQDLQQIRQQLPRQPWLVACLCAAWCDVCKTYRANFDALMPLHPEACFAWIDIEDHAELVEDLDIENFPTIVIQHRDKVLFLGTMLPDTQQLHRLLQSLEESDPDHARPRLQEGTPAQWNLRNLLAK